MGGTWGHAAIFAGAVAVAGIGGAVAAPCPGNPDALGTSRTILLNPADLPRVGKHDYSQTLPLAKGEVVLTFDDGPISPYTGRVLKALADECVKATFFMVGRNARFDPPTARQVLAAGHTIGTHSQNHPMSTMAPAQAEREIGNGFTSVAAALGSAGAVAPFFRFPGLARTAHAERYLRSHAIAVWSIDIDTSDWKPVSAEQLIRSTLARLQAKGRGIILLHDIQARTALALPTLLRELKRRGFYVVHVVPTQAPALPATELIAMPQPRPPWPVPIAAMVPQTTGQRTLADTDRRQRHLDNETAAPKLARPSHATKPRPAKVVKAAYNPAAATNY
jgi:peptidoglycan/xylan/chitin deacetylase (PgdA/CDA1 family)